VKNSLLPPHHSLFIKLFDRLDHRDYVFNRRLRLYVMNCNKDNRTVWRKNPAPLQHLFAHLCRGSEWKRFLRIDARPKKDPFVAVPFFHRFRIPSGQGKNQLPLFDCYRFVIRSSVPAGFIS